MNKPHLAIHISRLGFRKVFILQPRRPNGTFETPLASILNPNSTHVTFNGRVVK
jgi:hypothetical protein